MPRLPPAPDLDWSDPTAPRSRAFDDVYFSKAGGLAEAEAVFLGGCGLPEGWRNRDRFTVCELGFGAGINVLAAWRAWKSSHLPHAQLHISTIEAFPLAREDAARAMAAFPEVSDLAQRLLSRWPVRAAAPQRLWFPEDGFSLTVHIGDAETIFSGLEGRFDAWFLDGFAPARNPAMWSPALFRRIAALSAPGARLATYTVAGEVRRGLEAVGFTVEKRPGFAVKRERLEGRFAAGVAPDSTSPARATLGQLYPYAAAHPRRVAVIGAGVAGAAAAHALSRRGVETVVLEAGRGLGAGASGNPAGLVMPRLDRSGPLRPLFLAAYLEAVATYESFGVLEPCGVEERADARRAEALADLLADPPLPDDWMRPLPNGAAFHARAGLVRPLAAAISMMAGASCLFEAEVAALERVNGQWVLRAGDGRAMLKADAVVLACGARLTQFAPASFLPITLSRGQIEWGPCATAPAHAIAQSAYLAPYEDGVLFGATFDAVTDARRFDADDHAAMAEARTRNVAALAAIAPELAASLDPAKLQSRAALRATTPDRVPVAGLLPDAPAWNARFAALAHGGEAPADAPPPAHEGVYVIGGLGARGLTLAPLLGERLASEMFAEPQILPKNSLNAMHPARFLHRALKRQ
ncbi:MAG: bifunctional tRNA (5-methylaminomethyl-2-thiouridine)(34)-methyltransferase MnmD/FAD-dependent 5-carboxymethylaminomethyl-2-thiouridine(34) oxidoreductase MnmC [Hyphomonadaceae bacterium]|nr:bifunctional tRNA (5-methylaminomethyl-2-thiouridine)(34)-methyltransferase MnmD/FAD-dependent 5-carboxymethylaminomethyl-2-thiouridine(34) oxidoreductase MnmC [Hyphomonadaceae bacterium]